MNLLYYLISVLAVAVMGWEVYTILKRNKTVKLKGSDDPFFLMIALGVSMLLLAPQKEAVLATAIAAVLVLAALLFTPAVKRGFTEEGFQKFAYLIPWEHIKEARVETVSMSRIKVHIVTEGGKRSLLFLNRDAKDAVRRLQKHGIKVYIDKEVKLV